MVNKHLIYEGKKIAYQTAGKGYPILLLHGFCFDSAVWDDFQLDLIEEKYKVVRLDLPGFGKSDVWPDITIDKMAEVVKAVIDELKITRFVLVGHSMGGYVGLSFARQFPTYLDGLSLFHSHPYADDQEKRDIRHKSIEFMKRQGHVLFVKQMIPSLFNVKFSNSNAFLLEKLLFRATRYQSEGIIAAQSAMADRVDQSEVLKNIKVPVQFIIGKEDTAISAEKSEAQVHLPTIADIQYLDKAAHMGMFEERKKAQLFVRQFASYCKEKASM